MTDERVQPRNLAQVCFFDGGTKLAILDSRDHVRRRVRLCYALTASSNRGAYAVGSEGISLHSHERPHEVLASNPLEERGTGEK